MARNRHGAQKVKAYGFDCMECQDRGYTWVHPQTGLLTPCTCNRGLRISEQVDAARTDLQTHRKMSRNGVLMSDEALKEMRK